jgi:predicted metal-dependent HD superfamily phosphohydrolase
LIDATERYLAPNDLTAEEAGDWRIFLDMDLSILGGDAVALNHYEAGMRPEHPHVPEALFPPGRAAILERFLARDRLTSGTSPSIPEVF